MLEMSAPQLEWREQVIAYAQGINEFVARGLRVGWDRAGKEPPEPDLAHLVAPLIEALREANRTGAWSTLRDEWPPAHSPLIPWLREHGQTIPVVNFLPDGTLIARIGGHLVSGRTVHIDGNSVVDLPTVGFFGRSPNRKYFAFARSDGIEIREGWYGPRVTMCKWPSGLEDLPSGFDVAPFDKPPVPTQLVPFPDGRRVLLVSGDGIFVLDAFTARRLLPTNEQLREHFSWLRTTYPNDPLAINLDMEHGAVSHDGKLIAVGEQASQHFLFGASLDLLAEVPPASEYPHYASFSEDGSVVALNSCHFYNGATIGVATGELAGASSVDEAKSFPLHDGARIYAAVGRRDEFITGDAAGYLRAFSADGAYRWQHFIGSSVGSIDISDDRRTLAVSTYAGFLSIIRLDAGHQQPYQIGNGNHLEERRWIFWKDETPLIW
jgi:hypothetical protein